MTSIWDWARIFRLGVQHTYRLTFRPQKQGVKQIIKMNLKLEFTLRFTKSGIELLTLNF